MRRPLALLAILVPLTWVAGSPGTADAAVVTSVRGDTLTISGDGGGRRRWSFGSRPGRRTSWS